METRTLDQRLLSLDVMRGATIMAMIMVNNPGSWGKMYWPLKHAPWHGWTPTDLIFPFFVFMVGVAMAYSFRKFAADRPAAVRKVLWRTVVLIAVGLVLNSSGQWLGLLFGSGNGFSFETIRLPGVLQRIALAYLGASLVVLFCGTRLRIAIGTFLLLSYAAMLLTLPRENTLAERLSPQGNIVRVVDLAVLGANHMYTRATSEPTDPEGLLSTLPAIVTALLGFAVGCYLRRDIPMGRKLGMLLAAGIALAIAGQAWHFLNPALGGMPINKKLWTSSFVLLTAGLGTCSLVGCLWLFDVVGRDSKVLRNIATAFQMVGVNAIFVFVASGIAARLFGMIPFGGSNLRQVYYDSLFIQPLGNTELASFAYSLSMIAFWWLVLWAMWRMKWTVKV